MNIFYELSGLNTVELIKNISLIEMTPLNVFIFSKDNPFLAFQATFPPCGGQEQYVAPQLPLHPFMGERDRGKGGLSRFAESNR